MKYSEETVQELCTHLKAGNNIKDSCMLAGIHRDTYYEWKKTYPDFSDTIKRAETECKARNIAAIQADKSWQSKAWWLERKYSDEFKQRQEVEQIETERDIERAENIKKIAEELKNEPNKNSKGTGQEQLPQ